MIKACFMVARPDSSDTTQPAYASRDFGTAAVETMEELCAWVRDTDEAYEPYPSKLWSVDAKQDGKSVLHWRRGDAYPEPKRGD